MNNTIIDLFATSGKLILENSHLPQDNKERGKLSIDALAMIVKEMNYFPKTSLSVMGISLDKIKRIKIAAQTCDMERVTLFPFYINGNLHICLKAYGGDSDEFIHMLKLNQRGQNNTEMDALEKIYGIIIYCREEHTT